MSTKIKNFFKYNLYWLDVLNSPLKGLTFKVYFGRIARGAPYFLPRKLVRPTREECIEKAWYDIENKTHLATVYSFEGLVEYHSRYKKFVPIKFFGINWSSLGWKTKFDSYRFEWCPVFSAVIFGRQLHITIVPRVDNEYLSSYWEAWLNWEYETDKTLTSNERFKQMVDKYSCTWRSSKQGESDVINDHYLHILRPKYLKIYEQLKD